MSICGNAWLVSFLFDILFRVWSENAEFKIYKLQQLDITKCGNASRRDSQSTRNEIELKCFKWDFATWFYFIFFILLFVVYSNALFIQLFWLFHWAFIRIQVFWWENKKKLKEKKEKKENTEKCSSEKWNWIPKYLLRSYSNNLFY